MATLWVKLVCVWACCCGCRSSKEYCSLMLERMIRRVMRLSDAELRSRSKFLFMRYCLKAVWMVFAALRLTKDPPYFLSNISTCRNINETQIFSSRFWFQLVVITNEKLPSYPEDRLRAHSCQKEPCTSCSPLLLACGGPGSQVDGESAAPRPRWPSWRWGFWIRLEHCCCCHCSVRPPDGKASG